jgi:hypothetical protein
LGEIGGSWKDNGEFGSSLETFTITSEGERISGTRGIEWELSLVVSPLDRI